MIWRTILCLTRVKPKMCDDLWSLLWVNSACSNWQRRSLTQTCSRIWGVFHIGYICRSLSMSQIVSSSRCVDLVSQTIDSVMHGAFTFMKMYQCIVFYISAINTWVHCHPLDVFCLGDHHGHVYFLNKCKPKSKLLSHSRKLQHAFT